MEKLQRNNWIDIIKGITIMFVFWCHVQKASPVFNWIAAICVPTFLMVTGFLYASKSKEKLSFKSTSLKILKPYIVFSIISVLVYGMYDYVFNNSFFVDNLKINILKSITGYGIWTIWFLSSYLISINIYFLSRKAKRGINIFIYMLVALITAFSIHVNSFIDANLLNSTWCSFLLVSLFRGVACTLYIYLGHIIYLVFSKLSEIHAGLLSVLFLVVSFILSQIVGYTNFSVLDYGTYPILLVLLTIFGPIGFIGIIKILFKKINCQPIQFIGVNSLLYMGLHTSLKLHTLSKYVFQRFFTENNVIQNYFAGIVCMLFMICLITPLVIIFNKIKLTKKEKVNGI